MVKLNVGRTVVRVKSNAWKAEVYDGENKGAMMPEDFGAKQTVFYPLVLRLRSHSLQMTECGSWYVELTDGTGVSAGRAKETTLIDRAKGGKRLKTRCV